MVKGVRKLKCLLLGFFILIIASVTVVAGEVDAVKYIEKNAAEIMALVSRAEQMGYPGILSYDGATGNIYFSNKNYNDLDTEDKTRFMEETLGFVRECGLSAQSKNRLYNFIEDQDGTVAAAIRFLSSNTSADFVTASNWLRPFTGGVSTFLGIMCLIIFISMSISVVIDCAYLTLAAVEAILDRDDPNKKPLLVSREAWKSKREADSSNNYVSPMPLYFKRRIVMMVISGVCLLYLISGQIYDIMNWLVDSFGRMFGIN